MLGSVHALAVATTHVLRHLVTCCLSSDPSGRAAHSLALAREAARWLANDIRLAANVLTADLD